MLYIFNFEKEISSLREKADIILRQADSFEEKSPILGSHNVKSIRIDAEFVSWIADCLENYKTLKENGVKLTNELERLDFTLNGYRERIDNLRLELAILKKKKKI